MLKRIGQPTFENYTQSFAYFCSDGDFWFKKLAIY